MEFRAGSSLLAVCPYCSSAVARVGDDIGEAEILGRVAPLADLGSPLSLGISGRWGKLGFTLVGHVQYDHGAGRWNEWHAAFDDGRWGWLAEAQGEVYVTFAQSVPDLPAWSALEPGTRFPVGVHALTVVEKKTARFVSAEGELPFALPPGAPVRYCDLSGQGGVFGTLDFDDAGAPSQLFLGRKVAYDDLFDASVLREAPVARAAAAVGLNCPSCGSGIELRSPDEARRITCTTCDSLLDCEKGSELFLLRSAMPRIPEPFVPLGSEGRFDGETWTLYGQLVKRTSVDGIVYRWTEYLLHRAHRGWRWLVESDGHWSFVEPLDAAAVEVHGRMARCDGRRYARYTSSAAEVEGLRGEFYWKVAVGDVVSATDWVRPPLMVSEERSADEVVYARGRYLEPKAVAEAFGLDRPPTRPSGIAPHQPNPHWRTVGRTARIAAAVCALLVAGAGVRWFLADEAEVHASSHAFVAAPSPKPPSRTVAQPGQAIGPIDFEVEARGNLALSAEADVVDGALFLSGQLTHLELGDLRSFGLRIEHYGGYSGGSSWSSGAKQRVLVLGELAPGRYQLRLVPEWLGAAKKPPKTIRVRAVSDVFVGTHAVVAAALTWLLPVVGVFRSFGFEKRRWGQSDLGA